MQDQYGYYWIVTDNGVNRFDGYEFTIPSNTILSNNNNVGIYNYSDNLVLTNLSGIFIFNSKQLYSNQFYPIRISDQFRKFNYCDTLLSNILFFNNDNYITYHSRTNQLTFTKIQFPLLDKVTRKIVENGLSEEYNYIHSNTKKFYFSTTYKDGITGDVRNYLTKFESKLIYQKNQKYTKVKPTYYTYNDSILCISSKLGLEILNLNNSNSIKLFQGQMMNSCKMLPNVFTAYSPKNGLYFIFPKNVSVKKLPNKNVQPIQNSNITKEITIDNKKIITSKVGAFLSHHKKIDTISTEWSRDIKTIDSNLVFIQTITKLIQFNLSNNKIINQLYQYTNDYVIKDNRIYISTSKNGVIITDLNFKYISQYSNAMGLQSNHVLKTKLDNKKNLWVLSKLGIDKIDLKGKIIKVFNFKEVDDYLVKDFDVCGDTLKFWSDNLEYSLNYILRFNKEKIPIVLNKITVDDSIHYYKGDTVLKISPKWSHIKINFAGIYVRDQENIIYDYRIIRNGNKDNWQSTDQHILSLTSLQAGNYKLKIRAYHKIYPNICSEILSVQFIVKPFFYQTWWFYIILLSIATVIVFSFLRYRNKLKLDKILAESKLHRLTLHGLQNQMNPHFVFNALNTLQHFIIHKDYLNSLNFLSEFSELIRKILDNSRRDFVSLLEEIEFIQQYIRIEENRYSHKFKTQFNIEIDKEEYSNIKLPPMLIQPIVENAIKHGVSNLKENGHILIEIKLLNSAILLVNVIDNGNDWTISKNSTSKSKAILVLKERIELLNTISHKGKFELTRKGSLTYASLQIPI